MVAAVTATHHSKSYASSLSLSAALKYSFKSSRPQSIHNVRRFELSTSSIQVHNPVINNSKMPTSPSLLLSLWTSVAPLLYGGLVPTMLPVSNRETELRIYQDTHATTATERNLAKGFVIFVPVRGAGQVPGCHIPADVSAGINKRIVEHSAQRWIAWLRILTGPGHQEQKNKVFDERDRYKSEYSEFGKKPTGRGEQGFLGKPGFAITPNILTGVSH
ncbi:hypothetical protein B0H16DRAFT_1705229 [Mycena metata]|uniref:Uncharacterized protein n=1 Tax=Mycena metata TaxID=1033252 RepID=A0AAD7GMI2_9AGAR|nr:hypothetical protein B0H16DRAFT_1705229 [Mycena metata]